MEGLSMDRLKTLEIFQAVADKASFVRAANALNLSTPVVTRAVQDLEKLLGARLLQRSTRRVTLTAEGVRVLERGRALLRAFDELTADSGRSASEMTGDIRLTAPASFGASRLGPVLARFMARHPHLRVELVSTDAPLDLVEHGIDLALRVASELPGSLIARQIGEAGMSVFGAPAYLEHRGVPRHPEELPRHDCLIYSGTGRKTPWRFTHAATRQRVEPAIDGKLCTNSGEALLAAAVHGSGLALLPRFVAEEAVARGKLRAVLEDWVSPALGVYLAYSSRRQQPLRVRALIEHLARELDDRPEPALLAA
jgi:LysR family transcriptional regulator, regulator for bpeEF and oprC